MIPLSLFPSRVQLTVSEQGNASIQQMRDGVPDDSPMRFRTVPVFVSGNFPSVRSAKRYLRQIQPTLKL